MRASATSAAPKDKKCQHCNSSTYEEQFRMGELGLSEVHQPSNPINLALGECNSLCGSKKNVWAAIPVAQVS